MTISKLIVLMFLPTLLKDSSASNISDVYIVPKNLNINDINIWDLFSTDEILDKISLDDYLLKLVDNFKEEMPLGIPSLKIPVLEPYRPPEINIDVNEPDTKLQLIFRNLIITGFSNFTVDYLRTSLKHLNLSFTLRIPRLFAKGYYYMDGKAVKIIPVRGNGSWWLQMDNLTMSAYAALDTREDQKFQMGERLEVILDFETIQMDFENLLGGGKWTKVVMKILNDLGRKIFHKFQPELVKNIKDSLRTILNNEFDRLPIKAIKPGSTANEYVDQILQNVREQLIYHNMEPMELPDYVYNFTKTVMFITTYGEAKLYEGQLKGASTIYRTGDCILNATDEKAVVGAHLGLNDLEITYKGHAKLMGRGPTIHCSGTVETVSFYLEVEQSSARGSSPVLEEFSVTEMSTIWIDLKGLGPLTWIMKWILTGVTKLMEDFLIEKMTFYIRQYIEEQLSQISFPIG